MLKAKGEKIHRVRVNPNSKDKSTIDEQNVLVEELEWIFASDRFE